MFDIIQAAAEDPMMFRPLDNVSSRVFDGQNGPLTVAITEKMTRAMDMKAFFQNLDSFPSNSLISFLLFVHLEGYHYSRFFFHDSL
mmetsp:Transcript_23362/g.32668  ORF Transcript_23362/g.32668 Transcript_23362/m.32668 type:complete len:86 (-) Transcript_23362:455-712(-)